MEWLVLVAFIGIAVLLVTGPGRSSAVVGGGADDGSLAERRTLLAELRELDEDLAAGRISPDDRLAGRRALAPRLRAVTETLRAQGDLDASRSGR
jgi:hypothetical protein